MSETKPKSYGSGSGSEDVYVLEARSTVGAKALSEQFILTDKWQQVPWVVVNGACGAGEGDGIPVSRMVGPLARDHHKVNYEAAEAFAYRFLAQLCASNYGFGHMGVEIRIVKITLRYQYSMVEAGVGEIINRTDGPRPVFRPREEVGDVPLSARAPKKVEPKANDSAADADAAEPVREDPAAIDARLRANDPLTSDGAGRADNG